MFARLQAASTERARPETGSSERTQPATPTSLRGLNRGPVGHADREARGLAEHRQGAGGLGQRDTADVAGPFPGKL